ncbi:retention module-containing protein, partial [Vogesella amnigena]
MATTSSTSSTLNIAQGKVVALAGKIIAVMPDGTQHAVQVGEELASGVRLIIPADAFIELQSAGGDIVRIAEARDLTITDDVFPTQTAATDATDAALAPLQPEAQQVLAALQGGQDPLSQLEAAAAGLAGAAGGAEDGGNSYIILGRVSEGITGASLDLGIDNLGSTGRAQTSELPVTNEPPTIVVEQPTNQGPDGVANDGLVYEAGLDPNGSAEVGDASSDAEFATGTFSISDPEGLGDIASITINGITIPIASLNGATVPGAFGEITISYDPATGEGSYTYELTGPTTDIDNENVAETDTFSFFVTDNSGNNSGTAQMVVT